MSVNNEMDKIYHTVETIPKSNIKFVESGKSDILNTHTHMTAHFSGFVQTLL